MSGTVAIRGDDFLCANAVCETVALLTELQVGAVRFQLAHDRAVEQSVQAMLPDD